MKHLLVLAILAGTAAAETQISVRGEPPEVTTAIRLRALDNAEVDRVAVELYGSPEGAHAKLTFRVSTRTRSALSARVHLELTMGTAVTAMRYAIGGEEPIEAWPRGAQQALATYNRIVAVEQDPALLRLVEASYKPNTDLLTLSVYPISRGMAAVVTIHLLLPPATKLVLDANKRRRAFDLPWRAETTNRRVSEVTESTSMFAGDDSTPPRVERRMPSVLPTVKISDHRYELRSHIRAHASELRNCHALGRALSSAIESTAQLDLQIAAEGDVTRVFVGDLGNEDARRCIADEISSWKFRISERSRRVRQTLDLTDLE